MKMQMEINGTVTNVISTYNISKRFWYVLRRITIIFLVLSLYNPAQAQRIRYVSAAGNGNGLTPSGAMSLSSLTDFLGNRNNFTARHVDSIYFMPGNYNLAASLTIADHDATRGTFCFAKAPGEAGTVRFNGGQFGFLNSAHTGGSNSRYNFIFKDVLINGFAGSSVIRVAGHSSVSLDNVIISGCTGSSTAYIIDFTGTAQEQYALNIKHSSILANTSFMSLYRNVDNSDNTVTVNYSSICNNTFSNYLMTLGSGRSWIYNNTFSGNTLSGSAALRNIYFAPGLSSSASIIFINNTVYNSGGLNIESTNGNNAKTQILNNIVYNENTSANAMYTSPSTYSRVTLERNIFNTGTSLAFWGARAGLTEIAAPDFADVFSKTLNTADQGAGKQYHKLNSLDKIYDWDIHSGVQADKYIDFNDDQLGTPRPTPAALGSYDEDYMKLNSPGPTYFYIYTPASQNDTVFSLNSVFKKRMKSGEITFSTEGGSSFSSSLQLTSTSGHGTLTLNSSMNAVFHPTGVTADNSGEVLKFKFKVRQGAYELAVSVDVILFDRTNYGVLKAQLPGYVDPTGYNCFDFMGKIDFLSRYIFTTDHLPDGMDGGYRIAWSSNVLVADLDQDGYPELLAIYIGANAQGDATYGGWRGIQIHNGQTGEVISRLPFKNSNNQEMYFDHTGFHTATPFSLVDSDRDGTVELIIAFTRDGLNYSYGGIDYRNKVVSYNINKGGTPDSRTYSLTERWRSAVNYNHNTVDNTDNNNYHKAIPQICDFDGDGIPEVLVYNKIYNAQTGALKVELESMGTTVNTSQPASMATAYMGVNRLTTGGGDGDQLVPFNYIYDMDGDGIYDVVAGGKIYRIKSDFTYDIIEAGGNAASVGDGFTTVADIDGDDKPDVVVVKAQSTDRYAAIRIVVWNIDNGIIADRTATVTERKNLLGSNSYVFVGDIDGRTQLHNGREYRLPEIAILSANVLFNAASDPAHPNVSGIPIGDNRASGPGNYGGFPTAWQYSRGTYGALFAYTYDLEASDAANKLKVSFVLEHSDNSYDTGFTLFDFDNDGVNEICYRDQNELRIIKPTIPYVKMAYSNDPGVSSPETNYHPETILFRELCGSTTGFEYPVIADINNDGSAEIVVPGTDVAGNTSYAYVYAAGSNGDKFAPALPVWNQYMYDPFKVLPNLQVPQPETPGGRYAAPNRLAPAYNFTHEIKDRNGSVLRTIENFNPFNGNLRQATYTHGGLFPYYEPIVYLTELFIDTVGVNRPVINSNYIEFTIANKSSARVAATSTLPVAFYKNTVAHDTRTTITLGNLTPPGSGNSTGSTFGNAYLLKPGMAVRVRVMLSSLGGSVSDAFIIRVGDNSSVVDGEGIWRFGYNNAGESYAGPYNTGTGLSSFAFRDCDWSDQTIKISRFNVFNDFFTVQEFDRIEMDVLENDLLPAAIMSTVKLNKDSITMEPKAGYLTFNGQQGSATRVIYHHRDSVRLTFGVDSFRYRVRFMNEDGVLATKTATVYIYVMRSGSTGFVSCTDNATAELERIPDGIKFKWYEQQGSINSVAEGSKHTFTATGDATFWIEPDMSLITLTGSDAVKEDFFRSATFSRGKLTISHINTGTNPSMRWTGDNSSKWRDPENWETWMTENGKQFWSPAKHAPSICVDVIIPSNVNCYPELEDSASCRNIQFLDRAMFKNPHILKYSNASVEFKLLPHERDRFVMWSAPLMDMYSGDYRYGSINSGDVFMNYFQQPNPDYSGSVAVRKRFTATSGSLARPLELGRGFNLRVTTTTMTADEVLRFPQTNTVYNEKGANISVSRSSSSKLITDGRPLNDDGTRMFRLPVAGLSDSLIQVVNPYMAYLNMNQFIAGNDFLENGYYIWNGEVNQGFIAIRPLEADSNSFVITNPTQAFTALGNATYVAPLQSFVVVKRLGELATIDEVSMSPDWTTTVAGNKYTLRAGNSPKGVMHIKVSQGDSEAYAAMVNSPTASSFLDSEDMPAIAYDELPLMLYTFTVEKEALAINSSSMFDVLPVNLGIRSGKASETRLTFTGLATFGYKVAELEDRTLNRKVDLMKNPEYTFTVSGNGSGATEINDRFVLRFGKGTGAEETGFSKIRVYGEKNAIGIQSESPIKKIYVYDMSGKLIHSSPDISDYKFRLTVEGKQAYIVRIETVEVTETGKVVAR